MKRPEHGATIERNRDIPNSTRERLDEALSTLTNEGWKETEALVGIALWAEDKFFQSMGGNEGGSRAPEGTMDEALARQRARRASEA